MQAHNLSNPSGKKIYFMWSILAFAYMLSMFHAMTTAIFQPYLIEEFQITSLDITYMGSMFFYSYLFMQLPTGILVDRFTPRTVAFGGLLCTTIGSFFFAYAQSPFSLYVSRALIGLGSATIFVCILKFQTQWLKPLIQATMAGIACFIGRIGNMLAQSPLAYVVQDFGWRTVMLTIASICFITALCVFFYVQSPQVVKEKDVKPPSLKSYFVALSAIIHNRYVWPALVFYSVTFGSYVLLVGYSGTSWLTSVYNMNVLEASSYIVFVILGCSLAFVAVGNISDRMHSKKIPIILCGGVYVLCWGILTYYPYQLSPIVLATLLFFLGAFSAAYVLSFSYVQEITPKEYGGIAGAVVNIGGYLGTILIPNFFVYMQNSYAEPLSEGAFHGSFQYVFYIIVFCFIYSFWMKEKKEDSKDTSNYSLNVEAV